MIELTVATTLRGFDVCDFEDLSGQKCSLQESSIGTETAVWFGVDDANPMILAVNARKLGIPTNEHTGWVPYSLPKEVFLSTRMHLTQDMVRQLLPTLQKFAETGEL